MSERSNPWRTFGLAVIAVVALGGVLAVGYALGADDDSSSASDTSSAPESDVTEPTATATTQEASTVPTSTTSTTTTATTQPAAPSTFFQVEHWTVDLIRQWRSTDPSLAAAWYVGSFPPASTTESDALRRAKSIGHATANGECKSLADSGERFLDFEWSAGKWGVLDRTLSTDEATRMMHQMLMYQCPENA